MKAIVGKVSGAVFLGAVILLSSVCLNIRDVDRYFSQRIILKTPDGAIRLGKVYREELMTELEIRPVKGEVLRMVAPTSTMHMKALAYYTARVDSINSNGGVTTPEGIKENLYYSEAIYSEDIRVKIRTYMAYQSEFEKHEVDIETIEHTIAAGEPIISLMDKLKTLNAQAKAKLSPEFLFLSKS